MQTSFTFEGVVGELDSKELNAACDAVIDALMQELPEKLQCVLVMRFVLEKTQERLETTKLSKRNLTRR